MAKHLASKQNQGWKTLRLMNVGNMRYVVLSTVRTFVSQGQDQGIAMEIEYGGHLWIYFDMRGDAAARRAVYSRTNTKVHRVKVV